jgi:cytochrome P450
MTALAARHAEGEDRQDLLANCIFFINAGHQTTTTLLTLAPTCCAPTPRRWPPCRSTRARSFRLAAADPGGIQLPPAAPGQYGGGMC